MLSHKFLCRITVWTAVLNLITLGRYQRAKGQDSSLYVIHDMYVCTYVCMWVCVYIYQSLQVSSSRSALPWDIKVLPTFKVTRPQNTLISWNISDFCGYNFLSLVQLSSAAQSCLDSLQPHGLQHARLPCPSPTPGAYANLCPSCQWCRPTISSSIIPFSSHL